MIPWNKPVLGFNYCNYYLLVWRELRPSEVTAAQEWLQLQACGKPWGMIKQGFKAFWILMSNNKFNFSIIIEYILVHGSMTQTSIKHSIIANSDTIYWFYRSWGQLEPPQLRYDCSSKLVANYYGWWVSNKGSKLFEFICPAINCTAAYNNLMCFGAWFRGTSQH